VFDAGVAPAASVHHYLLAVNWIAVSSVVTGAGTLVMAMATFAAVRSSNRSARIAEAALQEQRRPVLTPSRFDDPKQKIMFLEQHWVSASGGRAVVEHIDGAVYLAISLRNVGSGIAVCQGWAVRPTLTRGIQTHVPVEEFRLQSRDLYIPAGDIGMWQGALRHPDDEIRGHVVTSIANGEPVTVELLYSDQVGRQRTITRFNLMPADGSWLSSVNRHWYLDWDGPRPESLTVAAAETILRDTEAASDRRQVMTESLEEPGVPTSRAGGTGEESGELGASSEG
jgi:hypothetical protein